MNKRKEKALRSVRKTILNMRRSEDLAEVVRCMEEEARGLGVQFNDCSIQIVWEKDGCFDCHFLHNGRMNVSRSLPLSDTAVWRCYHTGEVVVRRDLNEEDVFHERERIVAPSGKSIRCIVDLPFFKGTMAFNSIEPDAFSEEDLALLKDLAGVVSEAYTRFEDLRRVEQHAGDLEVLARISRIGVSSLNRSQIAREVVGEVIKAMDTTFCTLSLLQGSPPTSRRVVAMARKKGSSASLTWEGEGLTHALKDQPLTARAIEEARVITTYGSDDPQFTDEERVWAQEEGIVATMVVPLIHRERAIGLLVCIEKERNRVFTTRDVRLCRAVADEVSVALEHARLYEDLRRQAALDQVRAEIFRMRKADDLQRVLLAIRRELKGLGVTFDDCSVCMRKERADGSFFLGYCVTEEEAWMFRIPPAANEAVEKIWQGGELVYRRDLEREDSYGERAYLPAIWGKPIRSLVDVPFSRGTLAVNSVEPNAFSEDDVAILSAFAKVLSEEFIRYEDLQGLERTQEELRRSEERYRFLFEHMGTAVALEQGDTLEMVNARFEELTGYRREEVEGRMSYLDFLPESEQDRVRGYHEGRARGEAVPSRYECRIRRKDGELRWADVSVHLVPGTHQRITTLVDSTARKRAEAQLLQAERLAAVGQLAAGVAHEINNPLSGVIGYTEILLDEQPNSPLRADLEHIYVDARRAGKIVEDLLMFARAQRSERDQFFDLNEAIDGTVRLMLRPYKLDNIEIIEEFEEDLPFVYGHAGQIQRVMLNLLTNARDAIQSSGKGSRVTIRTRVWEDRVRIEVEDDGPGIPVDRLRSIFDPFFTTKEVGQGTGLGLSVSHGIVTRHGGDIWAESDRDHGARFVIELPTPAEDATFLSSYSPAEEQRGRGAEERPPRSSAPLVLCGGAEGQGGARVLVVDDEELVLSYVRRVLERIGCMVEVVQDGAGAWDRIAQGAYDLILLDLRMPGMDGMTLFEKIRRHRPHLARRIVFMTGEVLSPDLRRFIERTGNTYLPKPFLPERLQEIVRRELGT